MDVLAGGALAAAVTGHGWAWPGRDDLGATLARLARHPGAPAAAYPTRLRPRLPGPRTYWATVTALAAVQVLGVAFLAARFAGRRAPAGLATRRQLREATRGADATTTIGAHLGRPVRLRGEDSAIVIAPARAGKTTRLAVARIADAPGAVVATSTKTALVTLTAHDPQHTGRTPEGTGADGPGPAQGQDGRSGGGLLRQPVR